MSCALHNLSNITHRVGSALYAGVEFSGSNKRNPEAVIRDNDNNGRPPIFLISCFSVSWREPEKHEQGETRTFGDLGSLQYMMNVALCYSLGRRELHWSMTSGHVMAI